MGIIKQTIKAGNTIEVREGCRTKGRGGPGRKRRLKTKPTSEEQEKINRNRQLKQLTVIINANFGTGDMHISLDYRVDERPESRKEAEAILNRFIARLKYWYKKRGLTLKRVSVTEVGKRGALHHHLVISEGITPQELKKLWPYGRVHITPLESNGDYIELAEYLIKKTDWEFSNAEEMKGKRRYNTSQNLVRPQQKTKKLKGNTINQNPKPYKGYYIPKKSIYQSKDQETGVEYIVYRMVKIEPDFSYRGKVRAYRTGKKRKKVKA